MNRSHDASGSLPNISTNQLWVFYLLIAVPVGVLEQRKFVMSSGA